jgi:alkaline phosphatase
MTLSIKPSIKPIVAAVAAAVALASPLAFAGDHHRHHHGKQEAKYIILLVGDGMNIEHEIAASRYLFGKDMALSFHKLPYQADQATWDVTTYQKYGGSYDSAAIAATTGYDPAKGGKKPYPLGPELPGAIEYHNIWATDSASAATAWATGYKTDDGNINWLPGDPDAGGNRNNDGSLKTIAEHLRELKNYAVGIVSTVPFTHATPAGFVAHNKSRNNYHALGHEILAQFKPEVVIGAGYQAGSSCTNPLQSNFISKATYEAVCADSDYKVVTRAAGVDGGLAVLGAAQQAAEEGKKLFGLFGGSAGHFESLKPNDLPETPLVTQATRENPTFAEATLAALKVLGKNPNGFFLMAEQGDLDWAAHANDFARQVGTTKDLHDGTRAVIDFVNQPGDDMTWDNTLLIVTSDHSNNYMRNKVRLGAGDLPLQRAKTSADPAVARGVESSCHTANCYPDGEVSFASGTHTNELTRIYAKGAGTHRFERYEGRWYPGTRIIDNTQLFHMMMDAAGEPLASPLKIVK